ncbi:MAG: hypothetical protein CVT92_01285 [Bacteroidetes bacterium HGW-Bacteroidetes-1]|jgi:hypothetical protein|nr:MAG: hypothetical protein CVT92_01285 [Bacteroidetes bacterium HGW-Bacteroidetes-1]
MKVPVIKKLAETYSLEELQNAENAIYDEQQPSIEVEGEDEGEQLTHIIAAIWIKNDMAENGSELKNSLRNYTQKVRKSID